MTLSSSAWKRSSLAIWAQDEPSRGAALIVITAPNPAIRGDLQNGIELFGKLLLLLRMTFLQSSILQKFPITQRLLDQLIAGISLARGDVTISTIPLVVQGQTVAGWPAGQSKDLEEAIDFVAKNGVKCLVEPFPLAKANEAFDHMAAGKVRFRAVLTF